MTPHLRDETPNTANAALAGAPRLKIKGAAEDSSTDTITRLAISGQKDRRGADVFEYTLRPHRSFIPG